MAQLFEAETVAANVSLSVEAGGVPDVRADPDRLVQALGNLVGNAVRHTPEGGRITLRAQPVPDGVEFAVTDTGEGIPPGVLPVVFERSAHADAARAGGSAGLGLSIVRLLAEAMGGHAEATSTVGEGTTVLIRLPRWDVGSHRRGDED